MRQLTGYPIFLSNAYEARDLRAIHAAEIKAVIDLALNEPPLQVTRDLVYCRFPLIDGSGNPPWLIRAAVEMLAELLRANVPTLVYCSAGLSRTPVIVAAAVAQRKRTNLHDELLAVLQDAPADVSPALVAEVNSILFP